MAILEETARQDRIIAWACNTYGFDRKQFKQMEYDRMRDVYKLAFAPRRYPPDIVAWANKIHAIANDTLRGEVVRTAVPDFSAASIALADAILNQKMQVVDVDRKQIEHIAKTWI